MIRKNFFYFEAAMIAVILYLGFISCSKDEDNTKSNAVVGTWIGYGCADSNPDDLDIKNVLTLVFNADGSGRYLEKDPIFTEEDTFSYEMEGTTKGKAFVGAMGAFIYFEIVGDKMYVYGHGYGNDLDYLLSKQ